MSRRESKRVEAKFHPVWLSSLGGDDAQLQTHILLGPLFKIVFKIVFLGSSNTSKQEKKSQTNMSHGSWNPFKKPVKSHHIVINDNIILR